MNEKIKAALQKINEDPDLAARFNACQTPDECYAVASSVGEGFTKEEFVATMEELQAAIEKANELSDEDLSKTAGGIDWGDVTIGASVSGITGGSLVAASVAAI